MILFWECYQPTNFPNNGNLELSLMKLEDPNFWSNLLSNYLYSFLLLFHIYHCLVTFFRVKPSHFNRNQCDCEFFCEGESFPYTYFATGSSRSHKFTMLTNRKLHSLKVTSVRDVLHIATQLTTDLCSQNLAEMFVNVNVY